MTSRRTSLLLGVLCLVSACATTPRMTPAERLEFYRANAGEPVRSFNHTGTLWGWRALGDSALTVWPSGNRGYLLEFWGRCPDLAFATSIGLTNRTGRVSAGFDSVVFFTDLRSSGTEARSARVDPRTSRVDARTAGRGVRASCRIDTIRPINTRVVRESKRDLNDIEYVDRDPSVPDEPQ